MASAAQARSLNRVEVSFDTQTATPLGASSRIQPDWLSSSLEAREQATYGLAARIGLIVGGSILLWAAILAVGVLILRIN